MWSLSPPHLAAVGRNTVWGNGQLHFRKISRPLPTIQNMPWIDTHRNYRITNTQSRQRNGVINQPRTTGTVCRFSSSTKGGGFQLHALPFSVAPEDALDKFRGWAEADQGLKYLMNYDSVRIGAAYVPVFSFDLNVRFGNNWKPPMFSVYRGNTIHIPGLSAYAGYSYRRSLINPVHSTSLVFLGDETQPFGGWMLKDMVLKETGASISVIPDAWNATQARAYHVVLEELQSISYGSWPQDGQAPKVQAEIVNARRVFMPTFVIEYSILGLQYRAFVSGCDKAAPVAGNNHRILGEHNMFESPEFHQQSRNFLTWSAGMLRIQNLPFILRVFRPALTLMWFGLMRIWATIPLIGAATGVIAGYRKIVQPWMDARSASAEWERQRENEARMEDEDVRSRNDFTDTGAARQFFYQNKKTILDHLGGSYEHKEGDFDWYKQWEEWANQQWRQQEQAQQQSTYHRRQTSGHQGYKEQTSRQKTQEFRWDFDENDPYSVLDIRRGVTKQEVSAAFRKQMLKYHPDTQPNASEAQKIRLVERSKIITEAYRRIKKEMQ